MLFYPSSTNATQQKNVTANNRFICTANVSEHLLGQISCVMACSASKTRSPMEFSVFADRILRHFKSSQMVARLRQLRSHKHSQ